MAGHRPRRTASDQEPEERSPATLFRRPPPRRMAVARRIRARPKRFADERGVPGRLGGWLLAVPRLDSKPNARLHWFASRIKEESAMQSRIVGTTLPVLEFTLEPNESVISEAGELSWMSNSIQMQTHTQFGGGGGF